MIQSNFSDNFVGKDPSFLNIVNTAPVIAASDVPVLIHGESGTGKLHLAKAMHSVSARHTKPFISVNCATISKSLAESELFGHAKGTFSGTEHSYTGSIQQADTGTLFLNEVGELPLSVQSKLLRYLENKEIQPVDSAQYLKADVRIISGSSQDLSDLVKRGLFREDLYYRLNVVPMEMPALKNRKSDIPLLLNHLTQQLAEQHQLDKPLYSKESLKIISAYDWPGNVRDLRNFAERMLILFSGKEVLESNLPVEMLSDNSTKATSIADIFKLPSSGIKLEELEKSLFNQALELANGNQTKAAGLLGITRDVFLYRKKKYAI